MSDAPERPERVRPLGEREMLAERWIDRRAVFLLCAALVCLALVPLSPPGLKFVGLVLAAWCAVLAGASWLDQWSRDRS